ncbi:MAG: acetyl-CoA carboxylase carboxyl transferase subunit beta [Candidatus Cloacimonetes bacterium 4572_55]|nr:MAG: acetyl-CoA carboxylase carboxyl transferase subunit beta [Candidatus Cloacimonetes bacterium 4572_55]
MSWFKKPKFGGILTNAKKTDMPDNIWSKCDNCGEILYRTELDRNLSVCSHCGFHFRIGHGKYIKILLDENSFVEKYMTIRSSDPLDFPDYRKKLRKGEERAGIPEAIVVGTGKIGGIDIAAGFSDFGFMAGSMGSAFGEKLYRIIMDAVELKVPMLIVSASGGGARMQEGILSLMQMAKTSAALDQLNKAGLPFISILTHPTMGGVMASFSSLGDIIIAEPGALLGFAGPRVIQETIGEDLPDGFQRSEFQLNHGMADMVIPRKELRPTVTLILQGLLNRYGEVPETTEKSE